MPKSIHIGVIVGSLRLDSFNRRLASKVIELSSTDITYSGISIGELPLYNQDFDGNQPTAVHNFKSGINTADGIIFVTPEYNRSIPGVLKNAIDHGSRPIQDNCWRGKPAAIIGATPGKMGTAMAQQHLRNILVAVDMHVMAMPEAFIRVGQDSFDKSGNIDSETTAFLKNWIQMAVGWISWHSAHTINK